MNLYQQIDKNKKRTKQIMIMFFLVTNTFCAILTAISFFIIKSQYEFTQNFVLYEATIVFIFMLLIGLYMWYEIDHSLKKILKSNHGNIITNFNDCPYLYNAINNMSIAAGLNMPEVFVINDPSPNALAAEEDPQHAIIGVTTGLLQTMSFYELEGVIGHEMGHIKNYDSRVETVGVVLMTVFTFFADFGWWLTYADDDDNNNNNNNNGAGMIVLLGLIMMVLSWICYGLCDLIELSLSRNREYLADAYSVWLTRDPDYLMSALYKLEYRNNMGKISPAENPLYIVSPHQPKHKWSISNLMDTHPSTPKRLARLQQMMGLTNYRYYA